MKVSKYNLKYELYDNTYIVNTLNGAIAKINDSNLIDCLIGQKPLNDLQLDSNEINQLKKIGCLIDDDFDEEIFLKSMYRIDTYTNPQNFILTLIPTYNCNFNCSYCYQRQLENDGICYNKGIISEKMLNSLQVYINLLSRNLNNFKIEWFGGEPLLAADLLINFNHKIKRICEDNDCKFSSSIVTNGYLLSEDICKRLVSSGIKGAMITLDGVRENHNKLRHLHNGQGTYDVILENIKRASQYMKIDLRININESNSDKISNFITQLNNENINKSNIQIQVVPIATINTCYEQSLTEQKLYSDIADIYILADKLGFKNINMTINRKKSCAVKNNNSLVIDLNGDIFRCPTLAGDKSKRSGIYDINKSIIKMNYSNHKWNAWEPFDNESCNNCKYLPACLGGCVLTKIDKKNSSKISINKDKEICTNKIDNNLQIFLKRYIAKMEKEKISE